MAVLTDEEANRILSQMIEIFGDRLPDPEHYPLEFAITSSLEISCHNATAAMTPSTFLLKLFSIISP